MSKGKLIFNGKAGWGYERDGRMYDLLEGKSLGGTTTSEIIFVMETSEKGYKDLVTWFFYDYDGSPMDLLKICDENIY